MHDTAANQSSRLATRTRGAAAKVLAVCGLVAGLYGCAEDKGTVRQSPPPTRTQRAKPAQVDTPTVENADDRTEEIRRVCNRKASVELPRCWSEEYDRGHDRKFKGNVDIVLTISPSGQAQDVEVLNPNAEHKEFEKCVTDAARGWSYPTGQTVAPVQCHFFLSRACERDSMGRVGRAAAVRLVGVALFMGAGGLGAAWAVAAEKGAGRAAPATHGGDMQVEGVVGELDSAGCDKALAAHQPEIRKCYDEVSERLFYLGGRMQLKLHVAASGVPHSVAMVQSTVGSYEVEHCVIGVMQKIHFPQPKGGDGELTYPVEFAARTPVGTWAPAKVAAELKQVKFASCTGHKPKAGEHLATVHTMHATLYVGPGGKVTSVGFSADEPIDDKIASCVVGKVRALQLDDPLGKMVKVSCDLDGRAEGE